MQIPSQQTGRYKLAIDSSAYGGIRLSVDCIDAVATYGEQRLLEVLGDALRKLEDVARISDPASPDFRMPQ